MAKYLDQTGLQYVITKIDGQLEAKANLSDFNTLSGKVEGLITTGGQPNVIETVKLNGTALTVTDKAVDIVLSDYATKDFVNQALTSALVWKGSVANVEALPTADNKVGDVYHVEAKSAEYAWDGTAWVELGSIVDLSAYSTTEQVNGLISAAVADKATVSYVDTEVGKKADAVHGHAQSEIEGLVDALAGKAAKTHTHAITDVTDLETELGKKAVKTEVEAALAGKSDNGHGHAIADVSGLQGALDLKAVKTEVDSALLLKADADKVYTKTEADGLLGAKANSADVYAKSETYTKAQVDALVGDGVVAITTGEIDQMFANVA